MSRKNRLKIYKGPLTPAQTAEGINAAIRNARRLAEDARFLFDGKHFPSATSLAILAIEESGKPSILRAMVLAGSESEWVENWKEYRTHTKKNMAWIFPDLVIHEGARSLEDFRPMFEDGAEHPYVLDQVKQIGFYTDCLGDLHWSNPADVIDESIAQTLVERAELLADKKEVSAREIELWIENIGPVWKKDLAWMKQALINWHSAMQSEGLLPPGENEMAAFVRNSSEKQ